MSAAPRRRGPDGLLLDEMFAPLIAERLRASGVDCVAVAEDPILASADDPSIADAVLAAGRILVTNNVVDFERLRSQRIALGQPMPPLVYTSDETFPRDRRFVGRLIEALEHAARTHSTRAHGGLLWLQPPPPG